VSRTRNDTNHASDQARAAGGGCASIVGATSAAYAAAYAAACADYAYDPDPSVAGFFPTYAVYTAARARQAVLGHINTRRWQMVLILELS